LLKNKVLPLCEKTSTIQPNQGEYVAMRDFPTFFHNTSQCKSAHFLHIFAICFADHDYKIGYFFALSDRRVDW